MKCFPWILCVFWLMSACASGQQHRSADSPIPTRDTLVQVLRQQRQMYVVYGTGSPNSEALTTALQELVAGMDGWLTFHLVADTAAPETLLAHHPHLLLGTPDGHKWLREWATELPFRQDDAAIVFGRYHLKTPQEVLSVALYPSPAHAFMPVGVITAMHDQALIDWVKQPPGTGWDSPLNLRWGYQVVQAHQRKLLGMFDPSWRIGGSPHWDFWRTSQADLETPHLRIQQHDSNLSPDSLAQFAIQIERRIDSLRRWLGRPAQPFSPISLHLYPSAERMGLMQNIQVLAAAKPEGLTAHRLLNAHYAQKQLTPHEELMPFLRQALGAPDTDVLEGGLAVYLTAGWLREGHAYWAGRLAAANAHLSLSELLEDGVYRTHSPLIKSAMAGALVGFLQDHWGKEVFLDNYQAWEPERQDLARLEALWTQYLSQLADQHPRKEWLGEAFSYYRGMTLAHEGYNIYNSYGSDSAQAALQRLAGLHVNSIALVPYTGARSTSSPRPYPVWQRAGMENDAATMGSMIHAREMGMQTLLKPQIYFPGGWPGEVEMNSEADWKAFYRNYRQWIMHYAMLAAVHQVDAFCAGVEFAKSTQRHPDTWRQLILDIRELYPGPVTYAANWGAEAENLAFGNELDFIGVNCYYPLSQRSEASHEELKEGFERIKAKIARIAEQHQRPIVLTEIGFRCVKAPWTNPHAGTEGRAANAEDQAIAYEVVLAGLQEAEWCAGMFWWKWPSYLGYAHRNERSFTPCYRSAAQSLGHWYEALEASGR